MTKRKTWEEIQKFFTDRGVTLLSEPRDYKDGKSKLKIGCKDCGNPLEISYYGAYRGDNKHFRCKACSKAAKDRPVNKETLKPKLKQLGIDLFWIEKKKSGSFTQTIIHFPCKRCGAWHHITWDQLRRGGHNSNLLCPVCQNSNIMNPLSDNAFRLKLDYNWASLVLLFFNVKEFKTQTGHNCYEPYSVHHLKDYASFPSERLNLLNGFPVLKVFHKDQNSDEFKFIHSHQNPKDWGTAPLQVQGHLRLPFHVYQNFNFLDLAKHAFVEVGFGDCTDFIQKHDCYRQQGKHFFYIDVFRVGRSSGNKQASKDYLVQIFEQIRAYLHQFYPEIYLYTGAIPPK